MKTASRKQTHDQTSGKARRRKTSPQLALRIARARLRELHGLRPIAPATPHAGPPRFVQCWAVHGRPVTQALDESGQVWERVYRKAPDTTPAESWWERLDMTRKEAHP